jgi:hypothetical protein
MLFTYLLRILFANGVTPAANLFAPPRGDVIYTQFLTYRFAVHFTVKHIKYKNGA